MKLSRNTRLIAGKRVKHEGLDNDLLIRLADDARIPFSLEELQAMTDDLSQFTGRASQQTQDFLEEIVWPLLEAEKHFMTTVDSSLHV